MNLENYIGIPFRSHGRTFAGSDCWGVVFLYYFHEYGIRLNQFLGYQSPTDSEAISDIIKNVKPHWKEVKKPEQGDVVVIAIGGRDTHVGVYLNGGKMLHAYRGTDSCIEDLRSAKWKNRITGYYRHE